MEQVWFVAALWPLVALVAGLIANWLKISTALSEIVFGTVAQICGWSISRLRSLRCLSSLDHISCGNDRPEVSRGGRTRSERLPSSNGRR